MIDGKACLYCDHSDPARKQDGKIRCKRFSFWAGPFGLCGDFEYRWSEEEKQFFREAMADLESPPELRIPPIGRIGRRNRK